MIGLAVPSTFVNQCSVFDIQKKVVSSATAITWFQHRLLRRLYQVKKMLALGPTTEFSDRPLEAGVCH